MKRKYDIYIAVGCEELEYQFTDEYIDMEAAEKEARYLAMQDAHAFAGSRGIESRKEFVKYRPEFAESAYYNNYLESKIKYLVVPTELRDDELIQGSYVE